MLTPIRNATWSQVRNARLVPGDTAALHAWIENFIGPSFSRAAVCQGHRAPFDVLTTLHFDRPSVLAVLGPRGGGKSLLSALSVHLDCRYEAQYAARIMGGSEQQSRQIYNAIAEHVLGGQGRYGSDRDTIKSLLKREAKYHNGSHVAILPASSKASRGPHVPTLCLDEVDEMDRDIFAGAIGMAQEDLRKGHRTQVVMTSTWHHEQGLMAQQLDAARAGRFPLHEFCVFEVLEHCPDERSGAHLEKCPLCPIRRWCHADIDDYGRGVPKAKRSTGHYSIETLIQKASVLGEGVIRADYLCQGPRSEGVWFHNFDDEANVSEAAEWSPRYETHIPIDYGVHTGAIAFQVRPRAVHGRRLDEIHVCGEYYSESLPAEENARKIKATLEALMQGRSLDQVTVTMDPAGGRRDPIGPTGLAEYRRGGIKRIGWWPNMSGRKLESLRLIESFLLSGTGERHLFIHPRCQLTIKAFQNYSRKKVRDMYLPYPEDPQHPWEEMIDSLAGGLLARYPNGREDARPLEHRAHVAGVV